MQVKFIYSEKATKFCEIFTLLLTGTTYDKSKVEISQNFVAFSEYMNFTCIWLTIADASALPPGGKGWGLKELLVDDTAAELELLLDDFDKVVGVADETFCKDLIKSSKRSPASLGLTTTGSDWKIRKKTH